jgi:hypothetical protein
MTPRREYTYIVALVAVLATLGVLHVTAWRDAASWRARATVAEARLVEVADACVSAADGSGTCRVGTFAQPTTPTVAP